MIYLAYVCEACGKNDYSPSKGVLSCQHCGHEEQIPLPVHQGIGAEETSLLLSGMFGAIQELKNGEVHDHFDTLVNKLLHQTFNDLYLPNREVAIRVKQVIEDKTYLEEVPDWTSYYLGKLSGMAQVIGQLPSLSRNGG